MAQSKFSQANLTIDMESESPLSETTGNISELDLALKLLIRGDSGTFPFWSQSCFAQ